MYSLPTKSIINWDGFVWVFLQKYFPNDKTIRLRNELIYSCKLIESWFENTLIRLKTSYLNVLIMV